VFSQAEITVDVIMASACLPTLFQAVEIDGIPYWDGGYMGNPPLFPLFYETHTADCVLVQVNPLERKQTPRTAREIVNRLNEITFNGSLLRELRAVDFVTRLIDAGKLSRDDYMRVRMHRIDGEDELATFRASEKLNSDWMLLERLRDIGRSRARFWLERHFDAIGVEGTLDLRATFS
jgi:NTE family protein